MTNPYRVCTALKNGSQIFKNQKSANNQKNLITENTSNPKTGKPLLLFEYTPLSDAGYFLSIICIMRTKGDGSSRSVLNSSCLFTGLIKIGLHLQHLN